MKWLSALRSDIPFPRGGAGIGADRDGAGHREERGHHTYRRPPRYLVRHALPPASCAACRKRCRSSWDRTCPFHDAGGSGTFAQSEWSPAGTEQLRNLLFVARLIDAVASPPEGLPSRFNATISKWTMDWAFHINQHTERLRRGVRCGVEEKIYRRQTEVIGRVPGRSRYWAQRPPPPVSLITIAELRP